MKRTITCIVIAACLCTIAVAQALVSNPKLTSYMLARTKGNVADKGAVTEDSVKATFATTRMIVDSYGRLPLFFEVNCGQFDRQVKFLSRGKGYRVSKRHAKT